MLKDRLSLLHWSGIVALLAACASPGGPSTVREDPAAARAAINDANARGVAMVAAHDRAGFVAVYEENATIMTLAGRDFIGRPAIDSSLNGLWEATRDSGGVLTWKADSIEVHGDYAYEVGRGMFVRRPRGPGMAPDTMRSRYITFWRKGSDGQWRVSRDFTVQVPRPTTTR